MARLSTASRSGRRRPTICMRPTAAMADNWPGHRGRRRRLLKKSSATAGWRRNRYGSSDSRGAEPPSGSSGSAPASRASVASISVTTATPGIGSSTTSTTSVSTVGALARFTALTFFRVFFAPPLGLALAVRLRGVAFATVRFTGLFRADLEGFRALRRTIDLELFVSVLLVASSVEPYSPPVVTGP